MSMVHKRQTPQTQPKPQKTQKTVREALEYFQEAAAGKGQQATGARKATNIFSEEAVGRRQQATGTRKTIEYVPKGRRQKATSNRCPESHGVAPGPAEISNRFPNPKVIIAPTENGSLPGLQWHLIQLMQGQKTYHPSTSCQKAEKTNEYQSLKESITPNANQISPPSLVIEEVPEEEIEEDEPQFVDQTIEENTEVELHAPPPPPPPPPAPKVEEIFKFVPPQKTQESPFLTEGLTFKTVRCLNCSVYCSTYKFNHREFFF